MNYKTSILALTVVTVFALSLFGYRHSERSQALNAYLQKDYNIAVETAWSSLNWRDPDNHITQKSDTSPDISKSFFKALNVEPNAGSDLPVEPSFAKDLQPFEIGQFLFTMIDLPRGYIPWDFLSENKAVHWITIGTTLENANLTRRDGMVRMNVLGQWSTELARTKTELAWSVSLQSNGNEKFGAQSIEIAPGSNENGCFGSLYDGCDFDPVPSMKQAGLDPILYCNKSHTPSMNNLWGCPRSWMDLGWLYGPKPLSSNDKTARSAG